MRYTDPDGREVSDEDIRSAFIDWIRTRDKRLGSTDGDILRYIEDAAVRDGSIPTTEEIAEQAESALRGRIAYGVIGGLALGIAYGGGQGLRGLWRRITGRSATRAAGQSIPQFVGHGAQRAAQRGFTPARISRVLREGTAVQATGRFGAQTRYTLGRNTVVIANEGRNAGQIITAFSDEVVNGIKGFWVGP